MELVKERDYGVSSTKEQTASAVVALREALAVLVRLFAPFIPFAAEEVWSWWQEGSVHNAAWPSSDELVGNNPELINLASAALILIRKAKSDAKLSMKAEIESMELQGPKELSLLADDLRDVGKSHDLKFHEADELKLINLSFSE
jgi:valyl-tRNA synthetase